MEEKRQLAAERAKDNRAQSDDVKRCVAQRKELDQAVRREIVARHGPQHRSQRMKAASEEQTTRHAAARARRRAASDELRTRNATQLQERLDRNQHLVARVRRETSAEMTSAIISTSTRHCLRSSDMTTPSCEQTVCRERVCKQEVCRGESVRGGGQVRKPSSLLRSASSCLISIRVGKPTLCGPRPRRLYTSSTLRATSVSFSSRSNA